MKKMALVMGVLLSFLCTSSNVYALTRYGERYCKQDGFHCIRIQKGHTWESLFSDPENRDLVRRLNRMNINLEKGMIIAVPDSFWRVSLESIAPFPKQIEPPGREKVIINQSQLAWGAYDAEGNLVKWGPMSGGRNYCPDVKRGCRTVSGDFSVYRKQGPGCISTKFPRPNGGAKMPYCMHFYNGFAMHASAEVPGYNASHGCVRMFFEDAKWLNLNFVNHGTKVKIGR